MVPAGVRQSLEHPRECVFGASVALTADTLAVGAAGESSNATGVNGNQADVSMGRAGAVYMLTRSGTTWSQQAYVKASNTRLNANFGTSVALAVDTLAVSAYGESSNATGVNGDQTNTSLGNAGAVYVLTRTGTTWSQQAYFKASNTCANALFGISVAVVGDTLAVGSGGETSSAKWLNGSQADSCASGAGAVYVFTRTATTWSQKSYVKASNTTASQFFGLAVARSTDTLAVGAVGESSSAAGINGNQADTSVSGAGAVTSFADARSDQKKYATRPWA